MTIAVDYTSLHKKMYPEHIYVRSGTHFVKVETQTAYYFATIRKKLQLAWKMTRYGPLVDFDNGVGT